MRSLHKLAVATLLAVVFARVAFASPPEGSSVAPVEQVSESPQIDSFCEGLRAFAKSKPARVFAAFSKNGEPVSWKEYEEHVLQRRLRSLIGKYVVAEMWTREDNAALVETTSSSETGDWLHLVRYCYRSDGRLAKTDFSMSSFVEGGGIHGTRVRHFASDGRQIDATSEVRRLESDRKLKRKDFRVLEKLYMKIDALPFHDLMAAGAVVH